MKKSIIATCFLALISTPVLADDLSPLFGSVIGGVIGSQFGSGSGQAAMSALGAVIGYRAGSTPGYGLNYNQGHNQSGMFTNPCFNELYYEGRYDPQLAQSYCRGRIEYLRNQREQEIFNARQRGMAGY